MLARNFIVSLAVKGIARGRPAPRALSEDKAAAEHFIAT